MTNSRDSCEVGLHFWFYLRALDFEDKMYCTLGGWGNLCCTSQKHAWSLGKPAKIHFRQLESTCVALFINIYHILLVNENPALMTCLLKTTRKSLFI
jgi:hypothetical protein